MMRLLDILKRTVLGLPVLLVAGLILWSYYTFNFIFIALFVQSPYHQVIFSTWYHVALALLVSSYYMTLSTKPATVPSDYRVTDEQLRRLRHEGVVPFLEWKDRSLPIQTRGREDSIRFCTKCRILKPDRAHHCSMCGTCVMKMDHHCPWVNNCVGWHNYKYFVLFLFYGVVYVLSICLPMLSLFLEFVGHLKHYPDPTLHHGVTQITLVFFVAAALSVSMLGLLSLHLYLTATNQTTLESFQKGNFVRQTKSGWRQPTVVENIEEVFGKNRWRWLLPIGPGSQGNGYSFKVKYDAPIHDHDVPLLPPSASDAETIPF